MVTTHRPWWCLCVLVYLAALPASVSAFVISEIHYNAPFGQEGLEFVEISNDSMTPQDLSGFRFVDGIAFEFPPATILDGGEILVVAADAELLTAVYGIDNVVGSYSGLLDAGGERLTIVNHADREILSVEYNDQGKWPVGPDGTGHTLALRSIYADPTEPESWTQSLELGGSPGRSNFGDLRDFQEPEFEFTTLIDAGEMWRFKKGTEAFSEPPLAWTENVFNDNDWSEGPSGFGYGDDDDATVLDDMQDNYLTVAVRKRFVLTEEDFGESDDFLLGMTFDDGFCAFVNGVEVARQNCSEDVAWDDVALNSHEAEEEELFLMDPSVLTVGENVLALMGANRRRSDGDFSLIPRLIRKRLIEEDPPEPVVPDFPGSFNELYRGDGNGMGWLELFNEDASMPLDLSGLQLTDDPDRADPYVFPPDTTIARRGFLVLSETDTGLDLHGAGEKVSLFLLDPDGLVLASEAFDQTVPSGFDPAAISEGSFPDGGRRGWLSDVPTPGSENVVPRVTDIVINELYYRPPEDRPGEFLELFNRGTEAVDLSGFRFSRGIRYTFPSGTSLAPGSYLVVAEAPDLLEDHWGVDDAFGPYEGRLADRGENVRLVDTLGNLVDEVRYFDGGAWSLWADGRGASLELIDPQQDNDFGAAWGPSDESDKAEWEELSYVVPRLDPENGGVFNLFMPERGICHLDDISITAPQSEEPARNHVPIPGFEQDGRWRIEGTHGESRRITHDAHSGEACLELVATGRGDNLCNRIEIDTSALEEEEYLVSLWARWQRGSSLLILHGDFSPGPWASIGFVNNSSNTLSARLRMTVPWNLGTPGTENSLRAQLRAETGSDNLGPVITGVEHSPFSPNSSQSTQVVARVSDSDGVASVLVRFRDDLAGSWESAELFDDGAHEDGEANDGLYGGEISRYNQGTRVIFFVEAVDALDAVGQYPAEAPEKTLLYMVEGDVPEQIQIVMTAAARAELDTRPVYSNALVDATFIFRNDRPYYNVGMRFRGTGRLEKGNNYRVRFQKDQRFHRQRRDMNLSRRDRDDGMWNFLIRRNGSRESPAPSSDYQYVTTRIDGANFSGGEGGGDGAPGLYQTVDRDYLRRWFGEDALDGFVCLKGKGRRQFSSLCEDQGVDWATLLHRGPSPENYRFYWRQTIHQTQDNWEPFADFTRAMDANHTEDAEFARHIDDVLNVERFLRVLGPRMVFEEFDALLVGNGQNGYVVRDPIDGRWSYLPWDMGSAGPGVGPLTSVRDIRVARLFDNPATLRVHYRLLDEYAHGYFSAAAVPWFEALQESPAERGGSIAASLPGDSEILKQRLVPFTDVEFRIVTNDGNDFRTEETTVALEGEASVRVKTLLFTINGSEPALVEPTWSGGSTPTGWSGAFPMHAPENQLEIFAFGADDEDLGTASITIGVDGGVLFQRGDVAPDLRVNITDAVTILLHLFRGRSLPCLDAADVDDNGLLDVSDALAILRFLFLDGARPASPFPESGFDPTEDGLGCAE